MKTRLLAAGDLPAMEEVVRSNKTFVLSMPVDEALVSGLSRHFKKAMALDHFLHVGTFDSGGNLLAFIQIWLWCTIDPKGVYTPMPPDYCIHQIWSTNAFGPLPKTIDPSKTFSNAYIAACNAAVKLCEERGFTSAWVTRIADAAKFKVLAEQTFSALYDYKHHLVYSVPSGTLPDPLPEKHRWMGIESTAPYDRVVVKHEKI